MLFCTFQSFDYKDKPVLTGKNKIPADLFKNDVSHGVAWCMPITKNFIDSVVNIWISCPNYAQIFLVVESNDYHKIDKIAWYKNIVNGNENDFWNFINDDINDNYAEYVIPFSELSNVRMITFPTGIANALEMDINELQFAPPINHTGFHSENKEMFKMASHHWDLLGRPYQSFDILESFESDAEKETYLNLLNQTIFRIFSLFYMPMIVSMVINGFIAKDRKEMVSSYSIWKYYADKFVSNFWQLQIDFANWSRNKNLEIKGYDTIRNKFIDFYNSNSEVLIARYEGLGRNELCPCGSGKKFKKCCGKGYV